MLFMVFWVNDRIEMCGSNVLIWWISSLFTPKIYLRYLRFLQWYSNYCSVLHFLFQCSIAKNNYILYVMQLFYQQGMLLCWKHPFHCKVNSSCGESSQSVRADTSLMLGCDCSLGDSLGWGPVRLLCLCSPRTELHCVCFLSVDIPQTVWLLSPKSSHSHKSGQSLTFPSSCHGLSLSLLSDLCHRVPLWWSLPQTWPTSDGL